MAFPNISPQSVELITDVPAKVSTTMNGIEYRQISGGPYFQLVLRFEALSKNEQRQIFGHFMSVRGQIDNFSYSLPDYLADSSGTKTGNVALSGSGVAAGATSMTIVAQTGTNPLYRAGDLFKFNSSNKVYMLTQDINSGGTTAYFYPPARSAITGSTTVTFQNVTMQVRYENANIPMSVGPDEYADITVNLREDIND